MDGRIILGAVLIIFGLFIMIYSCVIGAVLIIFGLFILLNKKEDLIEERKDIKNRNSKKKI